MSWVIVGLGNPGEEYALTRHNTGRMAVEQFAAHKQFAPWKADAKTKATVSRGLIHRSIVALVLPDTFMNRSGAAVAKFVKSIKAAQKLIVVYDDLDMPLGSMKISYDRGSGGHKGVESTARAVKTRSFARIRIGVSPSNLSGDIQKPQGEKNVEAYILGMWKPHELGELKRVFARVSEALDVIVRDGVPRAMNQFN
jgi:peptidyl-tRNA hydrolase, PTH1 family